MSISKLNSNFSVALRKNQASTGPSNIVLSYVSYFLAILRYDCNSVVNSILTKSKYLTFFFKIGSLFIIIAPPPKYNVVFECSNSWILKICATYYLGYQTDLVKNLYKCSRTFMLKKYSNVWVVILQYLLITYYITTTTNNMQKNKTKAS